MIEAIEVSSDRIKFNSHIESFYYNMFSAYEHKNILPKDFKQISSSDWKIFKSMKTALDDVLELNAYRKIEEAKIRAEMQKRLKR